MEVEEIERCYEDRDHEQLLPPPWNRVFILVDAIVSVSEWNVGWIGIGGGTHLGFLPEFVDWLLWLGFGSTTSSFRGIDPYLWVVSFRKDSAHATIARKQTAKMIRAISSKNE
jgi:hypothetical protein